MSQRGKRGNNRSENDLQPPAKRRKGRPPNGTSNSHDNDHEPSASTSTGGGGTGSGGGLAVASGSGTASGSGSSSIPSTSGSSATPWQVKSIADIKMSSIYNRSSSEAPAELFRKDLISAMKLPDSEPLANDEYWIITDQWKQEWEKGVQVPVNPDSLPEPSVKILQNPVVEALHDFKLPKNRFVRITKDDTFSMELHYLTNVVSIAETACAYDLDQVDEVWLKLLNNERILCGASPITDDQFERVIEELEVRCWEKIQAIMKLEEGLGIEYDENVICDVCRSPDSEEANEMVFCDNCNICVHQACYGITAIPSGQWLCRTCSNSKKPECVLCPNKGGAMKSTKSGKKWAHVSCALWIPEVSIGCVDRMEPITKISSIPQSRWALICVLCKERVGACIQCSVKTCKTAYHVTCAFQHGLEMRAIIEEGNAEDGVKLRSYCLKHGVSKGKKDNKCGNNNGVGSGTDDDDCRRRKNRKEMTSEERNQVRQQRLQEVEAEFDKHVNIRDISCHVLEVDQDAIVSIYNYWLLKRKSRGNRALIPPKVEDDELMASKQEEADLEKRKMVVHLRQDLERVRNLCYMVNRREKLFRSFFKYKEQIYQKQIKILENYSRKGSANATTSATTASGGSSCAGENISSNKNQSDEDFLNTVICANNGPAIYDKFYSSSNHSDSGHFKFLTLSDVQEKLLGGLRKLNSTVESSTRALSATKSKKKIEKMSSYKKINVNGGITDHHHKGVFSDSTELSSSESSSDTGPSPQKSPAKGKKKQSYSRTVESRQKQKKNAAAANSSSSDDEHVERSKRRNLVLSEMERDLEKDKALLSSSNESEELIPLKNVDNRHLNRKTSVPIYSDSESSEDKDRIENNVSDSQHQMLRTKAAKKEFTPQQQQSNKIKKDTANKAAMVKDTTATTTGTGKKTGRPCKDLASPPSAQKVSKNKPKNKENAKVSAAQPPKEDDKKFSKSGALAKISDLLVVPQRQAAKKASENMRSTNVYTSAVGQRKDSRDGKLDEKELERTPVKEKEREKEKSSKESKEEEKADKDGKSREKEKHKEKIKNREREKEKERDKEREKERVDKEKEKETKEKEKATTKPRGRPPKHTKEPKEGGNRLEKLEKRDEKPVKEKSDEKIVEKKDKPSAQESHHAKGSNSIAEANHSQSQSQLMVAYVPQRQAAKKAAQHIKSGLGTKPNPNDSSAVTAAGDEVREKEKEKEKESPVAESKQRRRSSTKDAPSKDLNSSKSSKKLEKSASLALSDSSTCSSSSGSSSSSSGSSSSSEDSDAEDSRRRRRSSTAANVTDPQKEALEQQNSNCKSPKAQKSVGRRSTPVKESIPETKSDFKLTDDEEDEGDKTDLNQSPKKADLEREIAQRKADQITTPVLLNSQKSNSNKNFGSLDKLLDKKEREISNKTKENFDNNSVVAPISPPRQVEESKPPSPEPVAAAASPPVAPTEESLESKESDDVKIIEDEEEKIISPPPTPRPQTPPPPTPSVPSSAALDNHCMDIIEVDSNSAESKDNQSKDHHDLTTSYTDQTLSKCIADEMPPPTPMVVESIFDLVGHDPVKPTNQKAKDSFSDFSSVQLFDSITNNEEDTRATMNLVEKLRQQKSKRKGDDVVTNVPSKDPEPKTVFTSDEVLTEIKEAELALSTASSMMLPFPENAINFLDKAAPLLHSNSNDQEPQAQSILIPDTVPIPEQSTLCLSANDQQQMKNHLDTNSKFSTPTPSTDCFMANAEQTANFFKPDFVDLHATKENISTNSRKLDCEYDDTTRMQSPYMNPTNMWNENDLIPSRRSVSTSPSSVSESNDEFKMQKIANKQQQQMSQQQVPQQVPQMPIDNTNVSCSQANNLVKNHFAAMDTFNLASQFGQMSQPQQPQQQQPQQQQQQNMQQNGSEMMSYGYNEANQYNGPVSLFHPPPSHSNMTNLNQMPFPSPGAGMFPPPGLAGTVPLSSSQSQANQSNAIFGNHLVKPHQVIENQTPYMSAAFTSSSHNLALTAAIVSTAVDGPQPQQFGLTGPNLMPNQEPQPTTFNKLLNSCDVVVPTNNLNAKESPSKRTSSRFNQQMKSPQMHKSPGKSPRQMELLNKQNIQGNGQKNSKSYDSPSCNKKTRASRGSGNNRGRGGRGRGGRGRNVSIAQLPPSVLEFENPLGSIHNNLRGTVYDFNEDFESSVDLKSLRDRRRSFECRQNTTPEQKFSSPTYGCKIRANANSARSMSDMKPTASIVAANIVPNTQSMLHNIVPPVLPGPVDMRTYNSGFDAQHSSASQEAYNNNLLGAFDSGTADQTLHEIDEEDEKEFQSALKASGTGIRPKTTAPPPAVSVPMSEAVMPADLQVSMEATSEEISIDSDTTNTKASLSDSRNQLKLKIKGPLAHPDSYNSSSVVSISQNMNAQSTNMQYNASVSQTSISTNTGGGTSTSIRRMRKKELLRQYWSNDMNMDDSAGLPPVENKTALDPIASRSVGIPKAVDSMLLIPTKDDYKSYTSSEVGTKRKKVGARELRQLDPYEANPRTERRRSGCSTGSNISGQDNVKNSGKRRGRSKTIESEEDAAPLKITIRNNAVESSKRIVGCPPKKRLTNYPVPSLEILKRESMDFRKQMMMNFGGDDDEEKQRKKEKKEHKKKEHKSSKKKKKEKEKHEAVHVIENSGTEKIILRIGKRKPTEDGGAVQENNKKSPPKDATLIAPIRLKLARNSDGGGYVIGNKSSEAEKVNCTTVDGNAQNDLPPNVGNTPTANDSSVADLKKAHPLNSETSTGNSLPANAVSMNDKNPLPLSKDCEVR